MGSKETKTKNTSPKTMFVILDRENGWRATCSTFEEAKEIASDADQILEVSNIWEVQNELKFKKENLNGYI